MFSYSLIISDALQESNLNIFRLKSLRLMHDEMETKHKKLHFSKKIRKFREQTNI